MLNLLGSIIRERKVLFLLILLFYILVYLAATQHLIFTFRMDGMEPFVSLRILPNWEELIFRQRSPFLFEPIAVFSFTSYFKFLISVPNLLLALVLGGLVASNAAVAYHSFRLLGLRGLHGLGVLLGTVPAILSGAACCVPTLILVIGLQLTATLAAVWSLFVPLSFILLIGSLFWALKRIEMGGYR